MMNPAAASIAMRAGEMAAAIEPSPVPGPPRPLPIDRLQPGARPGTYRVTLAYPEALPFLDRARRRGLREEGERRFLSRGVAENRPILEEALGHAGAG